MAYSALCLARRHEVNWPNVKAGRGAPKGARTRAGQYRNVRIEKSNTLMQIAYGINKSKAIGRPRSNKLNPEWIDDIKIKHNLSGHGAEVEAVKIFVDRYTTPTTRNREIRYIQKRLSELRGKIPKT